MAIVGPASYHGGYTRQGFIGDGSMYRNTASLLLSCVLSFVAPIAVSAGTINIVDQQNPVGTLDHVGPKIGQSFTATLTRVDAAEFLLKPFSSSASVRLDLFGNLAFGFSGNIVGSSLPVVITNTTLQLIHFDLIAPVTLTPGNQYTFRLVETNGDWFRARYSGDYQYSGGKFFNADGAPFDSLDFVFREGIHVPEPSSVILAAIGLIGLAAWGWRRKR
jgi:hypothetical protein